jgi:hypothetical protein
MLRNDSRPQAALEPRYHRGTRAGNQKSNLISAETSSGGAFPLSYPPTGRYHQGGQAHRHPDIGFRCLASAHHSAAIDLSPAARVTFPSVVQCAAGLCLLPSCQHYAFHKLYCQSNLVFQCCHEITLLRRR